MWGERNNVEINCGGHRDQSCDRLGSGTCESELRKTLRGPLPKFGCQERVPRPVPAGLRGKPQSLAARPGPGPWLSSFAIRQTAVAVARLRSASHASIAPTTKMVGKMTSLIVAQPKYSSSWPEENDATAMPPKIRKSLNACTLLRSSARWHWVTMVVAPMKAKFQPRPSSTSALQKCATVVPEMPTAAAIR